MTIECDDHAFRWSQEASGRRTTLCPPACAQCAPRTSSPSSSRWGASVIWATASSNTAALCEAGERNPLTLRTYCRAAARISPADGSSWNGGRRVWMLRQMGASLRHRRRSGYGSDAGGGSPPSDTQRPPAAPGQPGGGRWPLRRSGQTRSLHCPNARPLTTLTAPGTKPPDTPGSSPKQTRLRSIVLLTM